MGSRERNGDGRVCFKLESDVLAVIDAFAAQLSRTTGAKVSRTNALRAMVMQFKPKLVTDALKKGTGG